MIRRSRKSKRHHPRVRLLHRQRGVNRFSSVFLYLNWYGGPPCKYRPVRSSQIQIFTQVYFSSRNYSDEVFYSTSPSSNFIVLSPLLDVLCFFGGFLFDCLGDASNKMLNCTLTLPSRKNFLQLTPSVIPGARNITLIIPIANGVPSRNTNASVYYLVNL